MANKSNTRNQINTEAVESLILCLRAWIKEAKDHQARVISATTYLKDENNVCGDMIGEFQAGLSAIETNIEAAINKMEKYQAVSSKVVNVVDSVKATNNVKFQEQKDKFVSQLMKLKQVANK